MTYKILMIAIILSLLNFSGCLVYEKVSYHVQLKTKDSGIATIKLFDLKSDAIGNKEFEEDKTALFDYMLKSEDFIASMKEEGKDITSRKLLLDGKKLNGEVVYSFTNISAVEGIVHQDDFYFLTLELTDSVLTTNGEVVTSDEHKRILWEDTMTELKFEMLTNVKSTNFRELSEYYK
jgi:hypothetical protein